MTTVGYKSRDCGSGISRDCGSGISRDCGGGISRDCGSGISRDCGSGISRDGDHANDLRSGFSLNVPFGTQGYYLVSS